ncbi:MAG: alpha-1,6-mannanase [Bacteroidales bacterium]|nr:alpha-1,6-mannanase [Bacteroidales bacterium]
MEKKFDRNWQLLKIFTLLFVFCSSCKPAEKPENNFLLKSDETLTAVYKLYSVEKLPLLRENYPFDAGYTATYLATSPQQVNQFAYLWPFSGTFSAVNALYSIEKQEKFDHILNNQVLPGLEHYFDTNRLPAAYSSYVVSEQPSDRFYDDNVWIGIDFTDLYALTHNTKYLAKAKLIWEFIESGTDDKLGGGIYWCEQKKETKNTCSNAPGAVFALKLFLETNDSSYYYKALQLYNWTKENLLDTADNLYFDHIELSGKIDKRKFPYNSGQMLQASALLYNITKNPKYLVEAQKTAKACYKYFFNDFETAQGTKIQLITGGNTWFVAVMLRGFIELYQIDKKPEYIEAFRQNLNYAWENCRDADGLFNDKWGSKKNEQKKWLLTQAAMVEMYARLAGI